MKMNHMRDYKSPVGISLISLIITIIVIIILAAVVIFTGLGTPDQANFAKFTSEFSDFDTAVQTDYANKYAEHAIKNETRSKAQIYYEIANGGNIEMDKEPEAVGEVQRLGLDLKGGEILGTEYYEITNDTNVDKWNRDKFYYEPEERHFITNEGTVFTMPGYLMEENGEQRWYINSKTYYVGEKKIISGEQVEPTDIYVKLYTDGTLNFSNNDSVTEGKTVEKDYGNIKGKSYASVNPEWYDDREKITSVVVENKIAPTDTAYWFCNLANVSQLDLRNLNTSNVTEMSFMFYGVQVVNLDLSNFDTRNVTSMNQMFTFCTALENINLSSFNTQNVTNMKDMFCCCTKLIELDLSMFDTSNVINMIEMFGSCSSLQRLNLNGFDTRKITSMEYMFRGCSSLVTLDLSSFNTSNVTSMLCTFSHCEKLAELDISSFDTSSVANMTAMFQFCTSLQEIDISGFKTTQATDTSWMFNGCTLLKTIYANENFDTLGVTSSDKMFQNCSQLAGENGTTYNSGKINKAYARVDDPDNGKPGYFTYRAAPIN